MHRRLEPDARNPPRRETTWVCAPRETAPTGLLPCGLFSEVLGEHALSQGGTVNEDRSWGADLPLRVRSVLRVGLHVPRSRFPRYLRPRDKSLPREESKLASLRKIGFPAVGGMLSSFFFLPHEGL